MNHPRPATDTAALIAARYTLRQAYAQIRALLTRDPTIPAVLDQLDEMCVDLTVEIEAVQPRLKVVA